MKTKRDTITIRDVSTMLERAETSKDGESFKKLFSGDWSGEYTSLAQAEIVLLGMLAKYSHCDHFLMDQGFRYSGLMRSSWDRNSDHADSMIQKAITSYREQEIITGFKAQPVEYIAEYDQMFPCSN